MMTDDEQKRIEKRLARIVATLPGDDGWWHSSGREAFMDLGREMLRLGAGLTEIEHQMRAVYDAVRQEYGD